MKDAIRPSRMRPDGGETGRDAAEAIGIEALGFLAADPDLARRFLQLCGLEAEGLRAAAADPSFFPALLDFILADERTLGAFAAHSGRSPQRIAAARRAFGGTSEWPG